MSLTSSDPLLGSRSLQTHPSGATPSPLPLPPSSPFDSACGLQEKAGFQLAPHPLLPAGCVPRSRCLKEASLNAPPPPVGTPWKKLLPCPSPSACMPGPSAGGTHKTSPSFLSPLERSPGAAIPQGGCRTSAFAFFRASPCCKQAQRGALLSRHPTDRATVEMGAGNPAVSSQITSTI